MPISFTISKEDRELVEQITARAVREGLRTADQTMDLNMDLIACHANGCRGPDGAPDGPGCKIPSDALASRPDAPPGLQLPGAVWLVHAPVLYRHTPEWLPCP